MKKRTPGVAKPAGATDPAMDTAQPDERDETPERDRWVDFGKIGPRQVIEQAGRDIAQGLQDSDLHGIPTNVPGPHADTGSTARVPASGGDKRSYSDAQGRKVPEDANPPPAAGGKAPGGQR